MAEKEKDEKQDKKPKKEKKLPPTLAEFIDVMLSRTKDPDLAGELLALRRQAPMTQEILFKLSAITEIDEELEGLKESVADLKADRKRLIGEIMDARASILTGDDLVTLAESESLYAGHLENIKATQPKTYQLLTAAEDTEAFTSALKKATKKEILVATQFAGRHAELDHITKSRREMLGQRLAWLESEEGKKKATGPNAPDANSNGAKIESIAPVGKESNQLAAAAGHPC